MYVSRVGALVTMVILTTSMASVSILAVHAVAHADTTHDFIFIIGNDDFTPENGITDGTGTQQDPYIIEGWEIEGMGIAVEDTDAHLIIRENSLITGYADIAISLRNVSHVLISDCELDGYGNGMFIRDSQDVRVVDNTVSCGMFGALGSNTMLWASESDDIEVRGNTLTNEGLFGAAGCNDPEFVENEATASCLTISYCTDAIVTDNSLADGIELKGDALEHYDSHEVAGNTVGGYSILYIAKKAANWLSTANLGQVIVANCDSIQISRVDFKSAAGVCAYFTESVAVSDCRMLEPETGVYARNCCNVAVSRCYVSDASFGIWAEDVENLNVTGSFFDECHNCVRFLADTVAIKTNMMLDSYAAIGVEAADAAVIYGNNFVNITYPVVLYGPPSYALENIVWNSEYPVGGNYWEDYEGVDEFSGPNQDEPEADGIGDTAYVDEDENVVDAYPLMMPVDTEFGPEVITDDEVGTSSEVSPLVITLAAIAIAVCILGLALYAINRSRRIRQRPPGL